MNGDRRMSRVQLPDNQGGEHWYEITDDQARKQIREVENNSIKVDEEDVEEVEVLEPADFYELKADIARVKQELDDLGLSVVDGAIYLTFEEE